MEGKFYICRHCGNIIIKVFDSEVPVVCCGEKMKEIMPNTVDASKEKHVPQIEIIGDKIAVTIGEVIHPMTEEHFIDWIYLETEKGGQLLHCTGEPKAEFISNDKLLAAYAYCNLHGLWKKSI